MRAKSRLPILPERGTILAVFFKRDGVEHEQPGEVRSRRNEGPGDVVFFVATRLDNQRVTVSFHNAERGTTRNFFNLYLKLVEHPGARPTYMRYKSPLERLADAGVIGE